MASFAVDAKPKAWKREKNGLPPRVHVTNAASLTLSSGSAANSLPSNFTSKAGFQQLSERSEGWRKGPKVDTLVIPLEDNMKTDIAYLSAGYRKVPQGVVSTDFRSNPRLVTEALQK